MAKPTTARILTINGGSSSIKFSLFDVEFLRRVLKGRIERVGSPEATFLIEGSENFSRRLAEPAQTAAVNALMDWLEERIGRGALAAVGHRVVQTDF